MNLPNTLTLGRIFLVPLLVVVLLTKFEAPAILGVKKEVLGAAIFGLASLTDWLDGYLARRRQQVTVFGQLMDPMADKLLITAALVSLVQMDLAPAWMVAVILGREFAVTVFRSLAHSRGIVIPASPLGKLKMVSQVVAILLLILTADGPPALLSLGQAALWVAFLAAVASGIDYYRRYMHVLGARSLEPSSGSLNSQGLPIAGQAPTSGQSPVVGRQPGGPGRAAGVKRSTGGPVQEPAAVPAANPRIGR